jgi:uncharacterized Zn finger protein (UPF0148 family)
MFEKTLRELKKLDGIKVRVPIEVDDEGYLDKECPAENCQFNFKVKKEDWVNIFKDEAVYCPLCRHEAEADSWWTTEQIESAKKQALKQIGGQIGRTLEADARSFNRRQPRDSFIKMSMKVSGFPKYPMVLPIPAKELLERKIQCEECGSRYAVIGSAFFCPCCGDNSVERTFDDSIEKILSKINNIDVIRKAFAEIGKKDEGEITVRSLIESSLSDGVTAFQRLSEELYGKMPGNPPAPFNVFQRIDDSSALWKHACGKSYEDWLTSSDLVDLKLLFQKRHLLAHREGIVDQKYIDRSGDITYRAGQRIIIKDSDIRRLVDLITKIANEIRFVAS